MNKLSLFDRKFLAHCRIRSEPTPDELQKSWDDAMAKWKAGGEHPLARHPHAVRCDGVEGCWTVAPIRDLSTPDCYSKKYCGEHLPRTEKICKRS